MSAVEKLMKKADKAKPTKVEKPTAAAPVDDGRLYTFGKPYRVRAEHNKRTWAHIEPLLFKGATIAQLREACKYADPKAGDVEHANFVSYLIRNGNVAELKKE